MMLKLVSWNVQLVPKHFFECVQLDDSLLSRSSTFFDDCMTLHLQDEDVEPVLIKDKTAEVDLSKDAWTSADYSNTVKADDFDPRNVTFFNMVNHCPLCLFSQCLTWVAAELIFFRGKGDVGGFELLSEVIHDRQPRGSIWICIGRPSDLPIHAL